MRFLFIAVVLASGMASAADAKRFGGTWTASFKGTVICTLEIEDAGDGKVTGVTKGCNVSVDQNGDLIEAPAHEGPDNPQPFLNTKVDGDLLRFEEEDGSDVLKFELRLTGKGTADLRILDAPITIKPIHFERGK